MKRMLVLLAAALGAVISTTAPSHATLKPAVITPNPLDAPILVLDCFPCSPGTVKGVPLGSVIVEAPTQSATPQIHALGLGPSGITYNDLTCAEGSAFGTLSIGGVVYNLFWERLGPILVVVLGENSGTETDDMAVAPILITPALADAASLANRCNAVSPSGTNVDLTVSLTGAVAQL